MGAAAKIQSTTTTRFEQVEDIALSLLSIFKPPERLTVSQTAAKYRKLNNPGAYIGPWKNTKTPMMIQPMDTLCSLDFDGLIFVGPAQSGKTDSLILNWIAHTVKSDPMDMIVYSPTTQAARDFSIRRVDRLHRHSPEIGAMLSRSRDSDNRLDKQYSSGALLTLSHPSPTEFAGKPVPRCALTDYDRMEDDIDGDGNGYDLASKRTTTFKSNAMCLAESSPSKPIENMQWIAKTAHEAPPAKGIFSLYNRGDRRRWYWPCPHCGLYFEGEWKHLRWDDTLPTTLQKANSVYMACPRSGCIIDPDERTEMNFQGIWLKDGQSLTDDGRVIGIGEETNIASFWMRGVAAVFVTWAKLVSNFIAADREYESTGSEEALKKFFNTDLAEAYIPRSVEGQRVPEFLKTRAESLGYRVVPAGVRFLIANVDVQKNAFVVQVHGICPGTPVDIVIVDRFTILKSNREDEAGDRLWVKPATYLEDWDVIYDQVMSKTYPLGDDSGRMMKIKFTTCDSGGYSKNKGESVTAMAYNYYRELKGLNRHSRFHLVKGDSKPAQPRTRVSYPDASKKDKLSAARGDVPVLMLNSNTLKDALNGRLDCVKPGAGMIRFPDWLEDWFYMELCAESRSNKGWENPPHTRNEAWDLLYYCLGVIASDILRIEHIDWQVPPSWAAEWDKNDLVSMAGEPERFAENGNTVYDLAALAEKLA